MTDEELAAIKARVEAATPGPWAEGAGKIGGVTRELVIGPDGRTIIAIAYGGFGHPTPDCTTEDRRFIAHARTDVDALLAEVERLKDALRRVQPIAQVALGELDFRALDDLRFDEVNQVVRLLEDLLR